MIDLYDQIEINFLEAAKDISVLGDFDCATWDNLLYKAARAFLQSAGIERGLKIRVQKKIPTGAGLGGGSSNAGFLLKKLQEYFKHPLSKEKLKELAFSLGSDVPFFLGPPLAWAADFGEKLESLELSLPYYFLLITPDFSITTKAAYQKLDSLREQSTSLFPALSKKDLVKALQEKPQNWPFFNSFYSQSKAAHPLYQKLEEQCKQAGAAFFSLSGSGSACFAVFLDKAECEKILIKLKKQGIISYLCQSL